MKEDLAIARNGLLTLQAENVALRQNASVPHIVDNANVLDRFDPEMAETLAEERKKRQEVEREMELQVNNIVVYPLLAVVMIVIVFVDLFES